MLSGLATSDPTEETLLTHIGRGVTVGANTTIGPGLKIGEFAMVGMGSVVTRDVQKHGLVIGGPARLVGYVCSCGPVVVKLSQWNADRLDTKYRCSRCSRVFGKSMDGINEIERPEVHGSKGT
jgi:UDP-2-acetamido-3-amino-2,3-dideoxy-glucuronate N-acetyltransferase